MRRFVELESGVFLNPEHVVSIEIPHSSKLVCITLVTGEKREFHPKIGENTADLRDYIVDILGGTT